MEEELEKSHHDLNRAQTVAKTGSWHLDVQKNELTWSDESYRIFGISKGTPLTYDTFLAAVHPEDRKYVDEKWNAATCGEPYDIEHRIITGAEIKWIREKAELEFDEQGKLLGGFGTCQDITDRKQAEAKITHLASFPELNPSPILELDAEGNIKYMNPATRALFPDLRIHGNKHPFLAGWKTLANKIQSEKLPFLRREIEAGNQWYGQTFTRVPSSQNLRLYSRDITERKRQEKIRMSSSVWSPTSLRLR
ncbi:MAG: PAS domain-containing protein [Chloroflexota bacterium]